jgi:hypothetical protein
LNIPPEGSRVGGTETGFGVAGGHDECMACVQPAAIQLRRRYAVPNER